MGRRSRCRRRRTCGTSGSFVLDGESYRLVRSCEKNDTLVSVVFPELKIKLDKVFDFEIPPEERIEMVREGRPPYGGKPGPRPA